MCVKMKALGFLPFRCRLENGGAKQEDRRKEYNEKNGLVRRIQINYHVDVTYPSSIFNSLWCDEKIIHLLNVKTIISVTDW